jgi:hypothetical protein
MRGIIVLGIGLVIALWVDHRYYDGMYSRETGDMIQHIAARFKHWRSAIGKTKPEAVAHPGSYAS